MSTHAVWTLLTLASAQADGETAPASGAARGVEDFRFWVWAAYGAALFLLAAYSVFVLFQVRNAERRLEHLSERFESRGGGAPPKQG
jgi:hypothetical protein